MFWLVSLLQDLVIWKAELHGEEEGATEARSLEFHWALPYGWQEPKPKALESCSAAFPESEVEQPVLEPLSLRDAGITGRGLTTLHRNIWPQNTA